MTNPPRRLEARKMASPRSGGAGGVMLGRISEWSVANRRIVALFMLVAVIAGIVAVRRTPLEALPDLSDVQVIVMTNWEGRSPTLVEDQVTYPIVTALMSAPVVKVVRGFSYFDVPCFYLLSEHGTALFWARPPAPAYLSARQTPAPQD